MSLIVFFFLGNIKVLFIWKKVEAIFFDDLLLFLIVLFACLSICNLVGLWLLLRAAPV